MSTDLTLAIFQRVDAIAKSLDFNNRLVEQLIGRVSESTHVTIAEAAQILGVSRTTIHRRFAAHLEQIPGKRGEYLSVSILKDAYVSSSTLAAMRSHEESLKTPRRPA